MKNEENSVAGRRKVRASMSLPQDLYEKIERVARTNKVSIAWVVRDAVEKYLESEKTVSRKRER
ncbi:MAG: ribbon-helix-helix protein, CopG family [Pirellulaceae bacterium]|nr:ribbon-helix-helix protein, CopG family [Pirellulaceae bacterium]